MAFEKNPIEKKQKKDKLEKEIIPKFLTRMLAMLKQSDGGFLIGHDVRKD